MDSGFLDFDAISPISETNEENSTNVEDAPLNLVLSNSSMMSDQRNFLEGIMDSILRMPSSSNMTLHQGTLSVPRLQGEPNTPTIPGGLFEHSTLNQGALSVPRLQGEPNTPTIPGLFRHSSRMLNFNARRRGRPSTNTRNGSSQTFYPQRSNTIKDIVLKRALYTLADWAKCLKTEGEVEKLPLIMEEEYDVIRRIIEIGEKVAENSSRHWR